MRMPPEQEAFDLEPEPRELENEKPYSGPPTVFECPKCGRTVKVAIETDERTAVWCAHNGNVLHGKSVQMKRRQSK